MKYKRLTEEELGHLEKEFISFLAHAQITAQDWEKLKRDETAKAHELIDVFSDVVYDKVLKKIKFLEFRDSKTLNVFKFDDHKVCLAGIRVHTHSPVDLTQTSDFSSIDTTGINTVYSEKEYNKDREQEIFDMLQTGCLITDERLYDLLVSLK